MKNNKLKLFGVALSLFTLAGCNYEVTPSNFDDALVNVEGDVTNNNYGVVYDELVDGGSINTAVYEKIIEKVIEKELPGFYEGENKAFANEEEFNKELTKLANEKLYDLITSSSYQTDNRFDEEKLVLSLKKSFYDIKCPTGASYNKNTVVFTPETKAAALDDGKLGGGETYSAENILHYDYTDYVERYIKKDIKKELLYSKYMLTENYRVLGSSYGRKVRVIEIESDTNYPDAASNTINAFIKEYVSGNTGDVDLNILSKLWKGVDYTNGSSDHELSTELKNVVSTYNLHTLADNIEEEYLKFMDFDGSNYTLKNADVRDDSLWSTYTGSHKYPASVGKENKDIELGQKDFITEGWFVKNGGLTDLPSEIRSRLFDPKTARDFLNLEAGNTDDVSGFVRKIGGTYFLVPSLTESTPSDSDVVFYDYSNAKYYIIVIDNVVNTDSLRYTAKEGTDRMNTLNDAYEIAKMLGSKDANKTEAVIYYLENAGLVFHDSDVWDYFYSNYEDAFEDED